MEGDGDKYKIEKLKRGRRRRKEAERKSRSALISGRWRRDYIAVCWGAMPRTAKLTGCSKSKAHPISQNTGDARFASFAR